MRKNNLAHKKNVKIFQDPDYQFLRIQHHVHDFLGNLEKKG